MMFSNWDTTMYDVEIVLNKMGVSFDDDLVESIFEKIDDLKVEEEALKVEEIVAQDERAYKEIERQICTII